MEGMFAFFLKAPSSARLSGRKSLGLRLHSWPRGSCARKLAFRLLHHRHKCLHAAPGGVITSKRMARLAWPASATFCSIRGLGLSSRTTNARPWSRARLWSRPWVRFTRCAASISSKRDCTSVAGNSHLGSSLNSFTDPAVWSRIQFAFTITYHYLFPQLTMGLAWFLVYWKWRALRTGDEKYNQAARFWAKIFGLNFAVGVVTGIPMEFQFGTNWAGFSKYAGGVIGQTLAMEGMFAFFLESAFIGALIWGEKRLGPRFHFLAALAVALGSWISGYFIIVTNAFMQHPVGYGVEPDGSLGIDSSALICSTRGHGSSSPTIRWRRS